MRVLHVHSGNLFGGIETLMCSVARHAGPDSEVEHDFALCFNGRLNDTLQASGAIVHHLGEARYRNPWRIATARRKLRHLLVGRSISCVVCHSAWAQGIFGPVARSAGVPLVFWLHGAANGRHWLERLAARTPPDLVIANSSYTQGTLARLYPGVGSDVLYPPVDHPVTVGRTADDRAAVRQELDTSENAVVIMQSSRLERWKGHRLHLEALARIADDPRWICWMAGGAQRPQESRYLDELRRLTQRLGLERRVRFLGERHDILRLLMAVDIHCQPNSEPEPFGIGFVEALYSGRAIVTTDMGGAREIIDATCGVLVPPGDVVALAEALRRLVSDRGDRVRLGAAGPARASLLCEPRRQLGRLDALCARLVRESSPPQACVRL
jgi:glycosyltransferase involved in cell wall biosynthesis